MLHRLPLSLFLLFTAPIVSPSLALSAATAAGLQATIVAVSYGAGQGENPTRCGGAKGDR
jgi:hypothetical protein